MLRGPLLLASFGLALNVLLWSVPGTVAASAVPHLVQPETAPELAAVLAAAQTQGAEAQSLPGALLQLIGAESEALHVAGLGLQQPTPSDIAQRADHAGARVLSAVRVYVSSAQHAFDRVP